LANKQRGEVDLQIGEQSYTLCVTLGGLAEIEDVLGCETLDQFSEKLSKMSMKSTIQVLEKLMRKDGKPVNIEEIRELPGASFSQAIVAIGAAFSAGQETDAKPEKAGDEKNA